MLSKRFKYDGKPIISLNELQVRMKKQIEGKIEDGLFSFDEVPCCVCDGKNFELLSKKDRYGLYVPVVICKDCGLIQTNPRMTQEDYNQFYDIEYGKLYRGRDAPTEDFFKSRRERGKRIYNYLNESLPKFQRINLSNLRVFEVGTASGGILHYFKQRGCEIYGCDLDSESIVFGRDKYDLNLEVGTIKEVVLPWNPNIVIYSHVLEHIFNPVDELIKLKSIVDEDAFIYIEVPGVKNLPFLKGYGRDFLKFLVNAHVYYFTLTTLKNVLRKAGWDFVCGNEYIHSIFKPSSNNKKVNYESNYEEVMSFLRRMEFYRLMPTPYNIKRLTMPALISFLKRAGLYNTAKEMHHKFKS